MLELFFKHLDFVAPELTERTYQANEKNIYKFDFEAVDKHWRSFYATYRKGYLDACNKIGVLAVREITPQ